MSLTDIAHEPNPQRGRWYGLSIADRFWSKVDASGICWEWTGSTCQKGYGAFYVTKEIGRMRVHRIAWELLTGERVPDDMTIDHVCRNRSCVNPDHLEVVTAAENTLRGGAASARNARKTHCPKGHPYDEANTLRQMGGRIRRCRTCENTRSKSDRARRAS